MKQDLNLRSHRSFSEKQLLCMARAILRRTKVLVMDEVRPLLSISYNVTDFDDAIRRLLGLNIANLAVICELSHNLQR